MSVLFDCTCRVYGCASQRGGSWPVAHTTYYRHKAAQLLADAGQERQVLPIEEVTEPVYDNVLQDDGYDEEDEGEEEEPMPSILPESFFDLWQQPLYESAVDNADNENIISVGEILLMFFEWMTAYKPPIASTKAMHKVFSVSFPSPNNFPSWHKMHKMLDMMFESGVVQVEMCPNDHIAFADMTHPTLGHYKHAHRTTCPVCNDARYIDNNGKKIAAKVGYYFKLDSYLASIFNKTDTTFLRSRCWDHSTYTFPPGHIRHSRRWHEKMSKNPHINTEPQNQAFVGMHDGIPLFRDKFSVGVVPIALRQANQPDSISKKFSNIHIAALYPCEYWCIDDTTKKACKERHKPAHLGVSLNLHTNTHRIFPIQITRARARVRAGPLMIFLANDLLHWYDGKIVTDHSQPVASPQRTFLCRCVLLGWCADYPGLGEACNFSHHGMGYYACHWCLDKGESPPSLKRMVYSAVRRYFLVSLCVCGVFVTKHTIKFVKKYTIKYTLDVKVC